MTGGALVVLEGAPVHTWRSVLKHVDCHGISSLKNVRLRALACETVRLVLVKVHAEAKATEVELVGKD